MTNLFENHWHNSPRQYGYWDDFEKGTLTADLWTILEADTGSVVNEIDAVGGQLDLVTGTVDENETYLFTVKEMFKFVNNKPCETVCRLAFAQGNTSKINVMFGFASAGAANHLQDAGAGPLATYSGAVFFVEEGQTEWSVETSLSTTQETTRLTAVNSRDKLSKVAAGGATTFHELRILVNPVSATKAVADFFIRQGTVGATPEVHVFSQEFTYTSATEMDVVAGVKCTSTTTEKITLDYIGARQLR